MVNVRKVFINRSSGPRSPVPLLLVSCVSSEMGLLICLLFKTLLSAVLTVLSVPDAAVWILSEYALSNFGFTIFFAWKRKGQLLTPFDLFFCFIGSWSETPPAPLNGYNCKVFGFTEIRVFVSLFSVSRLSRLLIFRVWFATIV